MRSICIKHMIDRMYVYLSVCLTVNSSQTIQNNISCSKLNVAFVLGGFFWHLTNCWQILCAKKYICNHIQRKKIINGIITIILVIVIIIIIVIINIGFLRILKAWPKILLNAVFAILKRFIITACPCWMQSLSVYMVLISTQRKHIAE